MMWSLKVVPYISFKGITHNPVNDKINIHILMCVKPLFLKTNYPSCTHCRLSLIAEKDHFHSLFLIMKCFSSCALVYSLKAD